MKKIDDGEYKSLFLGKGNVLHEKAYEIANDTRKFEIDNYWKRANYYWLFQTAVYGGYFYSVTAKWDKNLCKHPEYIIVGITCLGFLTALAWLFSNIGSKQWQKNWESHVDMLEDGIAGPLYKVGIHEKTWSVSKINEIVSGFSVIAWILLGIETVCSFFSCTLLIAYLAVLCIIASPFYFYGRKGLGDRDKEIQWFKKGEE